VRSGCSRLFRSRGRRAVPDIETTPISQLLPKTNAIRLLPDRSASERGAYLTRSPSVRLPAPSIGLPAPPRPRTHCCADKRSGDQRSQIQDLVNLASRRGRSASPPRRSAGLLSTSNHDLREPRSREANVDTRLKLSYICSSSSLHRPLRCATLLVPREVFARPATNTASSQDSHPEMVLALVLAAGPSARPATSRLTSQPHELPFADEHVGRPSGSHTWDGPVDPYVAMPPCQSPRR